MALIVAIDGPAGAGKSTIARKVAASLGLIRVNTGAIYRALTWVALADGAKTDEAIVACLPRLDELRFEEDRVFLGETDITRAIRSPEITKAVSRVSAIREVRDGLLETQRALAYAHERGAVMEGRDIGTVVFPSADIKIFLTASAEERARRRMKDLDDTAGATYEEVLADIKRRDSYDSDRAVAPLKPADDARIVDSTGKSAKTVVEEIVSVVRNRDGASK